MRLFIALTAALSLIACGVLPDRQVPTPATPVAGDIARGPFVSAANPQAAEAGMAILRRGGSAVDAAVAVQAVLGLVEPQSSGLGGGAFLVFYDADTREVTVYDGRETAPAAATPELFIENGAPMGGREAVLSGRSVGAPGAVAMLAMAQGEHGRLPWSTLFGDAERLAREGFVVPPRMGAFINTPEDRAPQSHTTWARAYFERPDGSRPQAGEIMTNPAYAETVQRLAAEGPDYFYRGELAREIVAAVRAGDNPGGLTLADLAAYRPARREAICQRYRIYVVCVPPPPSSGVALLQLLAMAERTPDIDRGADSPEAWVAFARLQRLMYADRDLYVGDADHVDVPVTGLLDPAYVEARAALVPTVTGPVSPGTPPGAPTERAPDATREPAGTSHFVIVDSWGNAVSMTTTVESLFGSGRMAGGFFLNNQMTDFSFSPVDDQGRPAANAVAPGKRPRSSMSPVIILDREERLVGALGSPGGNSILAYNAKALIGVLDWNLSMQAAFDLPNLVVRGASVGADTNLFEPDIQAALAAAGAPLRPNSSETSGLHGAIWRDGHWDSGADNRRDGVSLTH
ncbi:MAG: gamma-glutamyltransferase family protein [Caulobacterales bacterium]|nr:gamma-glutamyltransferase family protein [Caulobacterales bacterium]